MPYKDVGAVSVPPVLNMFCDKNEFCRALLHILLRDAPLEAKRSVFSVVLNDSGELLNRPPCMKCGTI